MYAHIAALYTTTTAAAAAAAADAALMRQRSLHIRARIAAHQHIDRRNQTTDYLCA